MGSMKTPQILARLTPVRVLSRIPDRYIRPILNAIRAILGAFLIMSLGCENNSHYESDTDSDTWADTDTETGIDTEGDQIAWRGTSCYLEDGGGSEIWVCDWDGLKAVCEFDGGLTL